MITSTTVSVPTNNSEAWNRVTLEEMPKSCYEATEAYC